MNSAVSGIRPADSAEATKHFGDQLKFETDCWDVHHAVTNGKQDFVILDVRGEDRFHAGHIPMATHLPHWRISEAAIAHYDVKTLFVVYCAGPHCNGAVKAAIALAELGRPVKVMAGGALGWTDEGFDLVVPERRTPVPSH